MDGFSVCQSVSRSRGIGVEETSRGHCMQGAAVSFLRPGRVRCERLLVRWLDSYVPVPCVDMSASQSQLSFLNGSLWTTLEGGRTGEATTTPDAADESPCVHVDLLIIEW
jgi:hypothetical protein